MEVRDYAVVLWEWCVYMPLESGVRIQDWVLDALLGQGTVGEVYACHHVKNPEERAALKRLVTPTPDAVTRLRREAAVLERLQHPSIVDVRELHQDGSELWLILELLEGRPLRAYLTQPALPQDWALHIVWQLTDALTAAHDAGIYHRDVKPDNAILSSAGGLSLLDFGVAAVADLTRLTTSGVRSPATPHYAPLEWFSEGFDDASTWAASDVYACGVLLLELCEGRAAFPPTSFMALAGLKRAPLAPPTSLPRSLGVLLQAMTAPEPADRPAMSDVAEALSPWRIAPPGSPPSPLQTLCLEEPPAPPTWEVSAHTTVQQRTGPEQVERYELLDELGRGGMGVVYRARDTRLGREVALKVLLAGDYAADTERTRFLREAKAVALLNHPSIVRVYDSGEVEGRVFFTMQFINGPSLQQRLADGPLPPHTAASIALTIGHGLAHAHELGLVHRDIKPANILLEDGVRPMLTDFGLVKALRAHSQRALGDDLTRGGQVIGTPTYMAPEQARGDLNAVGAHTDQYALGVLLYEMLTGQPPFNSGNLVQTLSRILTEEPQPPRGAPADLAAIALRALEKSPTNRYPDTVAMLADLQRYLDDEPVLAASPSMLRLGRAWARRQRTPLVMAGLVVAISGVSTVMGDAWSSWGVAREESTREAEAEHRRLAMNDRIEALYASGELAEADALFQTFVDYPNNHETRALALVWLEHAEALRARGEGAPSRTAYATGYALAETPTTQRRALLGLGQSLRDAHRWAELRTLISTLRRRSPEAIQLPAFARLARDLALSARDLEGALSSSPDDSAALLSQLSGATRTPWTASDAFLWDTDGDGQQELALHTLGKDTLQLVDPSQRHLPALGEVPAPTTRYPRGLQAPDGTPLLLSREGIDGSHPDETRLTVLALEDGVLVPQITVPDFNHFASLRADLDGDGEAEVYLAHNRRLEEIVQGTDGWTLVPADTSLNDIDSEIRALKALDLDGDGQLELVLTTSDWGGYDVRILRRGADGALHLITRDKLGRLENMAVAESPNGPFILTTQIHDTTLPRNQRVFGPNAPMAPRGVYSLALRDERLERVSFSPLVNTQRIWWGRANNLGWGRLSLFEAGDIDGDGFEDVVWSRLETWTTLYHHHASGEFTELTIGGLTALAFVEVDGDPQAELVVLTADGEQRIWVLGAGEDVLPPLEAAPESAAVPPPAQVEGALREAWRRAEDLYAMGQASIAIERLEVLARLAVGTPVEALALYRAGQLAESSPESALTLTTAGHYYERAADAGISLAPAALHAARRCYAGDLRPNKELVVLERLIRLGGDDAALWRRHAQLVSLLAEDVLTLRLGEELPAGLQLQSPTGTRWAPELGGMRHTVSQIGESLALPLSWNGDYASVEVVLDLKRMDWSSKWRLSLQNDGGEVYLGLESNGGGNVVMFEARCTAMHSQLHKAPLIEHLGETLTLRLELNASEGLGSCGLSGDDIERRMVIPITEPPTPGPLRLTISQPTLQAGVNEVVLREVRLQGLQLQAPEHPRLLTAHHQLASHHPDRALEILSDASDVPSVVARAAAREELGRSEEADRLLISALAEDPTLGGYTRRLFQTGLDRFEAPLRAALGPDYFAHFWSNLMPILNMHAEEEYALDYLTNHLTGLRSHQPPTPEAFLIQQRLLLRRGAAWRQSGRSVLAHQDLTLVLENLETWREAGPHPGLETETLQLQSDALQEYALIALARQQPELAMANLTRALALSPTPTILADAINIQPRFTPLREQPEWSVIEEARKIAVE